MAADIVIFDPETIDSSLRPEMIHDFPGKVGRLVARARGLHYTIVNGAILYENGATQSDARPGRVLRSTADC